MHWKIEQPQVLHGRNEGKISKCTNNINITHNGIDSVTSGISGVNVGIIENCVNNGQIISSRNTCRWNCWTFSKCCYEQWECYD